MTKENVWSHEVKMSKGPNVQRCNKMSKFGHYVTANSLERVHKGEIKSPKIMALVI